MKIKRGTTQESTKNNQWTYDPQSVSYTHLDVYKRQDKERVTIEELLLHQSGIPAFWPFYKETIDCLLYTSRCV